MSVQPTFTLPEKQFDEADWASVYETDHTRWADMYKVKQRLTARSKRRSLSSSEAAHLRTVIRLLGEHQSPEYLRPQPQVRH